jgi:hypothetical protein
LRGQEIAKMLRAIADEIEKIEDTTALKATLTNEKEQIGAAGLLFYLKELFKSAQRVNFRKGEIIHLLEQVQKDKQIFLVDIVTLMEVEVNEDEDKTHG